MKLFVFFVFFVIFVAFAFFLWRWWTSDERVIRSRLRDIAAIVSVPARDSDLGRITRVAQLRHYLADDIRISAGSEAIVSRELVLAAFGRWTPFQGGVTVEFVDVHVAVNPDRLGANVDLTARMTGGSPQGGEPTVDAQEVRLDWRRADGEWVVSEARTEPILSIGR